MIKLNNGAKVLAVHMRRDYDGTEIHGTVMAQTHSEYVTWRVSSFDGGENFDAYSGEYPSPGSLSTDAYVAALENFSKRLP